MREACGHALHHKSASLAPFAHVAKANQTELVVVQTAQGTDVAHYGPSKRERKEGENRKAV